VVVGVVGCLWHFFAPTALGGSTSYVVTEGISMEPRFHTGDLAVVRARSDYHVGEIVAYYNKAFHTIVLHRIVGRDGSRYVFKGDNNHFLDFEHPTRSQLIGALWIHLPGVGGTLQSIRSPALIGALVMIGTLLLAGGVFTQTRRRRRRGARAGNSGGLAPPAPRPQGSVDVLGPVLAIGGVALVAFVLLALLAFTRPLARRVPFAVAYQQSGTLSYTAHSSPGPIYANDTAVTGEPLFTHVLNTAELHYAYRFEAPGSNALAGTASLAAEVTASSGWHTIVPLASPLHFHGDHVLLTAPLDLHSLEDLVNRVAATTGVDGTYSMTLLPRVNIGGSVSTLPLQTSFSQQMKFNLTQLELEPTVSPGASSSALGSGSGAGSGSGETSSDPFTQSSSGAVKGKHSQPFSLSLGLARVAVGTGRDIALGGIFATILALLGAVAFLRPTVRAEADNIRSRYSRLIVPVAHVAQLPGVSVIDVADIDSLARLAEHYDRSILHESSEAGDVYWITDESGNYRCTIDAPATVPASVITPEPATVVTGRSVPEPVTMVALDSVPEPAHAPAETVSAPEWSHDPARDHEPTGEAPTAEFAVVRLHPETFAGVSNGRAEELHADELELGAIGF
jgi:signal peptidase I